MYRDIWWYSIGVCISLRLLCVLYVHTETKFLDSDQSFAGKKPEASAWYHFLTTSMFVFLTNTGAGVRLGPNSSCPTVICIYNYIYICIPSVWQQDQVMPLFQNPWHHIEWATWRQFNDNSIMQRQFITLASAPDSATPIWPHVNSRSISKFKQAGSWTGVSTWKEIPTRNATRNPQVGDSGGSSSAQPKCSWCSWCSLHWFSWRLDSDGDWPLVGHNLSNCSSCFKFQWPIGCCAVPSTRSKCGPDPWKCLGLQFTEMHHWVMLKQTAPCNDSVLFKFWQALERMSNWDHHLQNHREEQ